MEPVRRPLCVKSETDLSAARCPFRLRGQCCHSCFEGTCPLDPPAPRSETPEDLSPAAPAPAA